MIERFQPFKIKILPYIFKVLNYLYSNNHANKEHIVVFSLFFHNITKIQGILIDFLQIPS